MIPLLRTPAIINRILEIYGPALFFILGFVFDIATLDRIDTLSTLIPVSLYLSVALGFIIRDTLCGEGTYTQDIIHFALGALLSSYTLFFFKSASILSSLAFMLFMVGILLFNETKWARSFEGALQVALLTLVIHCTFILFYPLVFGSVSGMVFWYALLSGSALLALVIYLLAKKLGLEKMKKSWVIPATLMTLFLILSNLFKVIPPAPLAVQEMGIYHHVEKDYPRYYLSLERPSWKFWQSGDQDFKARPGDKVYVFARIFAPGGVQEKIILHWQNYQKGWVTSDRIALTINGGRSEGHRGYAYKQNYTPGSWRVSVETEDGREISRLDFEIYEDTSGGKRLMRTIVDGE